MNDTPQKDANERLKAITKQAQKYFDSFHLNKYEYRVADGWSQVYLLNGRPHYNSMQVRINGILQTLGEDYRIEDKSVIFHTRPKENDILVFNYFYSPESE
jgi:hypothetical protein